MNETDAAAAERTGRITEQAADLQDAYLMCRTLGHPWKDPDPPKVINRNTVRLDRDCARCDAFRWVVMTVRGHVIAKGRAYPADYVLKDTGRLDEADRDLIRAEMIARLLESGGA